MFWIQNDEISLLMKFHGFCSQSNIQLWITWHGMTPSLHFKLEQNTFLLQLGHRARWRWTKTLKPTPLMASPKKNSKLKNIFSLQLEDWVFWGFEQLPSTINWRVMELQSGAKNSGSMCDFHVQVSCTLAPNTLRWCCFYINGLHQVFLIILWTTCHKI